MQIQSRLKQIPDNAFIIQIKSDDQQREELNKHQITLFKKNLIQEAMLTKNMDDLKKAIFCCLLPNVQTKKDAIHNINQKYIQYFKKKLKIDISKGNFKPRYQLQHDQHYHQNQIPQDAVINEENIITQQNNSIQHKTHKRQVDSKRIIVHGLDFLLQKSIKGKFKAIHPIRLQWINASNILIQFDQLENVENFLILQRKRIPQNLIVLEGQQQNPFKWIQLKSYNVLGFERNVFYRHAAKDETFKKQKVDLKLFQTAKQQIQKSDIFIKSQQDRNFYNQKLNSFEEDINHRSRPNNRFRQQNENRQRTRDYPRGRRYDDREERNNNNRRLNDYGYNREDGQKRGHKTQRQNNRESEYKSQKFYNNNRRESNNYNKNRQQVYRRNNNYGSPRQRNDNNFQRKNRFNRNSDKNGDNGMRIQLQNQKSFNLNTIQNAYKKYQQQHQNSSKSKKSARSNSSISSSINPKKQIKPHSNKPIHQLSAINASPIRMPGKQQLNLSYIIPLQKNSRKCQQDDNDSQSLQNVLQGLEEGLSKNFKTNNFQANKTNNFLTKGQNYAPKRKNSSLNSSLNESLQKIQKQRSRKHSGSSVSNKSANSSQIHRQKKSGTNRVNYNSNPENNNKQQQGRTSYSNNYNNDNNNKKQQSSNYQSQNNRSGYNSNSYRKNHNQNQGQNSFNNNNNYRNNTINNYHKRDYNNSDANNNRNGYSNNESGRRDKDRQYQNKNDNNQNRRYNNNGNNQQQKDNQYSNKASYNNRFNNNSNSNYNKNSTNKDNSSNNTPISKISYNNQEQFDY